LSSSLSAMRATSTTSLFGIFTESVLASFDQEFFVVDQYVREFFSCLNIDTLYGCSSYLHLLGALFLCETFPINQANGFIFIHAHDDGLRFSSSSVHGSEAIVARQTAYLSSFHGSCHTFLRHFLKLTLRCVPISPIRSSVFCMLRMFLCDFLEHIHSTLFLRACVFPVLVALVRSPESLQDVKDSGVLFFSFSLGFTSFLSRLCLLTYVIN
jgi:hypothetical protein